MKKIKGLSKLLTVLALSSTAFVFAACGKNKNKPTTKPVDDDEKYDATLKMKYKVFNGEAEITQIDKQGEKLVIPSEIGGATVTRVSCTYTDSELKEVEIPATLTYLTGNGFMNCENLSTVTFSGTSTLTDIPSKAFLGTKISSITIPASVKSISFEAFQDIDTLTSVTFESGSNLESIGPFAFYNCDGLTSVSLPNKLVTIGESSFEKCENLSTIGISNCDKLETIERYAFSSCVKITILDFSNNVVLTKIGANAFRGCTNLSSVTFNSALREIESKAFYNTQKITNLVLPENLNAVGDEAFVNAGIVSLEIKSGSDTTFGPNAFSQYIADEQNHILYPEERITSLKVNGNLSLEKIFTDYAKYVRLSLDTLHVTGDRIALNAYKGCINLSNLTVDESIEAIGESAFEDCTLISNVTLTNKINEISKNTFKNCINLVDVTLPETVAIVRDGAFDGCVKVHDLDLSKLTIIGANAFRNTLVSTPTFSRNLQSIGEYAFENCVNVEAVVIDTKIQEGVDGGVPSTTIRQNAFKDCKNITAVNLSSNVVLENDAFVNDTNVEALTVRGEYGLETLFGETKAETAKKIKTITIQDDTETIEANAFNGCLLVTQIIIPSTVKKIGDEAFRGCRGITTLNLPENLEKIGKYAFAECDKLVLDKLPEKIVEISEGMFQSDYSIGAFSFNEGITRIGDYAFRACSNLTIANFKDSIVSIGDSAFYNCLKLEISKLPDNLEEIGESAFSGCLLSSVNKTNDKLKYVGSYAFKGCQSISSFEFVNDLTLNDGLGAGILEGCTKVAELKIYGTSSLEYLFGKSVSDLKPVLSKITIKGEEIELADNMFKGFTAIDTVELEKDDQGNPKGIITRIGSYAFSECENLTEFDISNVQILGSYAFAGSGLTKVTIPSNGIIIGEYAFANCISLSQLTFEASAEDESLNITAIPAGMFSGTILVNVTLPDTITSIGSYAFSNIVTLNNFTISENSNLTSIYSYAFSGCSNVLNFSIPSKVSLIDEYSFSDCTALRTVNFAATCKIEKICAYAFSGCYALTVINYGSTEKQLPNTIREIGNYAFASCTCLVDLGLPETLEILGSYAFSGCQSLNNVKIPDKIEIINTATFMDCYMLDTVIWNSNIKIIYDQAFYNTSYKTAIPITVFEIHDKAFASDDKKPVTFAECTDAIELGNNPNGVSLSIGNSVFVRSGITSVILGAKVTELGDSVFALSSLESADFSNIKITKIGDSMFEDCASFASINLGTNSTINTIGKNAFKKTAIGLFNFSNILSIGDSAFEEAKDLALGISLGTSTNNVTIGEKAFFNSGITSLVLGARVIKLGDNAFAQTADLESANLSALDITSISDSFFADCEKLDEIIISNKIRTIGSSAFANTAIEDIDFLRSATALEQIGSSAFEGCVSLKDADIPNTVSYVGIAAFKECAALETVSWSTSANVINDNTFNGCALIGDFTVPSNVSRIGNLAFSGSLNNIIFESPNPPSVDEQFVSDFDTVFIVVPSITNYKKNYVFAKVVKNITE